MEVSFDRKRERGCQKTQRLKQQRSLPSCDRFLGVFPLSSGSCLGALRRLLQLYPQSFTKEHGWALPKENGGSALANAGTIFQALTSFLITHAHWDHIAVSHKDC